MNTKFILASLIGLFAVSAANADTKTVTFNFCNVAEMKFSPKSFEDCLTGKFDLASTETAILKKDGNNFQLHIIPDEVITLDGAQLKIEQNTSASCPRLGFTLRKGFEATAPEEVTPAIMVSNYWGDARWYKSNKITVTAPDGYKINKVEMKSTYEGATNRVVGNTLVTSEGGTQTISTDKTVNTWETNAGVENYEVVYEAEATAPTQIVYTIELTLEGIGAAVADIALESTEPEYYNINGTRLNAAPATPGLYLVTKNGKTQKVVIK